MLKPPRSLPAPTTGVEVNALLLVAWAAFASIPLALGGIGLSWDALNHHVYLGWIADRPRFDRDFLAASYQSFTYPYLYWPFYKLFQSGISGQWAGVVLVSLNVLAVPPLWLLARVCVPEWSWYGTGMRWLAVTLAFLSGVVLSMFDSTSNDLIAAIPLVWAVALAFESWDTHCPAWLTQRRIVLLSGLCAGAAVAFKLSNGPLAILMPLLWGLPQASVKQRFANIAWGSAATVAGFFVLYGYWGWQLWSHYGNPMYPFFDHWFAPLRALLGWQQ
jgi:hypothetical protein